MFRVPAQTALFEVGSPLRQGSLDDVTVRFVSQYLSPTHADKLFAELEAMPGWRQDAIRVYGKSHALPRLHRWFADAVQPYRWSGIEMHPEPFPATLATIRQRLDEEGGVRFNTALGNLYRSGKDSVSWHSDDEPDLGSDPVIASLSLGATRRFLLRKKADHSATMSFDLTHGSLLWMSGPTQAVWEHSIPKTTREVGTRINLTFRAILHGAESREER